MSVCRQELEFAFFFKVGVLALTKRSLSGLSFQVLLTRSYSPSLRKKSRTLKTQLILFVSLKTHQFQTTQSSQNCSRIYVKESDKAILAWRSAYKTHIDKIQTKQFHSAGLIFIATAHGEHTESALPLLNLLDVLTVHVYRSHILKFTYLWHKGLLPKPFSNYFQYASNVHKYNTRYTSKQNLYVKKVRTNVGKQTIGYAACVIWDKIPLNLKELSVYQFSK